MYSYGSSPSCKGCQAMRVDVLRVWSVTRCDCVHVFSFGPSTTVTWKMWQYCTVQYILPVEWSVIISFNYLSMSWSGIIVHTLGTNLTWACIFTAFFIIFMWLRTYNIIRIWLWALVIVPLISPGKFCTQVYAWALFTDFFLWKMHYKKLDHHTYLLLHTWQLIQ